MNKTTGRPKGPERKRVHVTLTTETWEMVEQIAELTGQKKAAVLAEVFETTMPAFISTIEALRVVKERPREAQRLIQNFASKSVMDLQQQQLDLDEAITSGEKKRRRPRGRTTQTK